ncbi:MAG: hypothetical protein IJ040_06025 [Lachnospiraceae bacterium]|nr:hypothetical protein [Lachnospiraceae bacterium]
MNQMDSQIVKFIKRVRSRMTEQKILFFGIWGAMGGFGLAVIFSVIALFVPWYYAPVFAIAGALLGILVGIVLGIIRKPNMTEAALGLDAHGFHERLITSYGLIGKEDVYSQVQKQDTLRRLGAFQIRKTFPLKVEWQKLVTVLGLALAFVIISFIPTASKEAAQEYHEIAQQVQEEVAKVDEAIEKIESIENLSELEKENMISTLVEAKKELQGVENAEELAKAKERIEVKMTQEAAMAENRSVREELQKLSNGMSDTPKSQEQQLAEDLNDLQKDLQNLNENTSQADRQAIANEMQRLGQQTGNQTMQNQAQNVANNTMSQDQLQQLQQEVSNEQQTAQNNSNNNQMANNSQMGQTTQNGQNGQNNQNGQNGQENQNGQNNQNGQENQNGQGNQNGQENQNGQTMQNAQGNENGQGNQDGENGNGGSGEGNQGAGGEGGTGTGGGYNTGSNVGTQKDVELTGQMITIPNREFQENESLDGKVNTESGSATYQKGGEAWAGTSVDYQQVVGDYSQNAYSKVESSNYPSGVQDIVKSYFEELNK